MGKYHQSSDRGSIQAAIWLIGLGILFLTDWFWPGILILVGVSMLFNSLYPAEKTYRPQAEAPVNNTPQPVNEPAIDREEPLPSFLQDPPLTASKFENDLSRLPSACPWCGGPVDKPRVIWSGPLNAACLFCGSNLLDTKVPPRES